MLRSILLLLFTLSFVATQAQQKLYPVRNGQKWGMINAQGKLVLDISFDNIGEFEVDGYAIAQKGDLLGVIDTLGKMVIPCKYAMMTYVGKGLFSVYEHSVWKIINTAEKVVFDNVAGKINFLKNGYLTFEEMSGLGLAHVERGILLPALYEDFEFLNPDLIVATDMEFKQGLFDGFGKEILAPQFDLIKLEGSCLWTKKTGLWGAYTLEGQNIIPLEWRGYKTLNVNFLQLTNDQNNAFLYSFVKDSIVLENFTKYEAFDNINYALFFNNQGKRGLVDTSGRIILNDIFDYITDFGDNAFRVSQGNVVGLAGKDGKLIAPILFQMIGNLDTKVAIFQKDKKYGVLNFNGEVVVPPAYTNLSLEDNTARAKDSTLFVFNFNEEGQLEDNTKFTNFKSLKIRGFSSSGNTIIPTGTATAIVDPNQISDSLTWVFHPSSGKWGLWNTQKGKYKFPPKWNNITVHKDLGITIVGFTDSGRGGKIKSGRLDLKINQVFGVFINSHGLPVTKMEFLDIRVTDFQVLGMEIARCVFVGGSHGVINKNGKVLSRGFAYIGEFVEGKARATRKGTVLVDLDKKIKRPMMAAHLYYSSLKSGYSFDNDDDARLYVKFRQDGQIYCHECEWGYLDTFGQARGSFKYQYVEDYTNGRALVQHQNKWGMIDELGNEVIKPTYDDFNFLENADKKLFYISQQSHLQGAIDSNGLIVVPALYHKIREYHDNRIAVRNTAGKWGFVDRNAKEIIRPKYQVARDFSEGLSVVYESAKWGAIDVNGNIVIKAQYSKMGDFKEGKAWVSLPKGQKGYINPQNELLFSGDYAELTDFENGIARVNVSQKGWGLINEKGDFILKPKPNFEKITAFDEHGLAQVKIGNQYRLINQVGEFVGKSGFELIHPFREGYAVVRLSGSNQDGTKYGFIDTLGTLVTTEGFRQLGDFYNGRAVFTGDKSKRGYINTKGEIVIDAQYFKAENFHHNRAIVYINYAKTGLIDTTGKEIIPMQFSKITSTQEGLALVRKNSWTSYFVDEDSKRHSPVNYQAAHPFQNGVAPIKEGGKWGIVNKKAIKTLIPKYSLIEPFKDGIAKVHVHHLMGVVDVHGKIIIQPEYEYISYAGEGLFRVEKGNSMGYLDMEGKWVFELIEN